MSVGPDRGRLIVFEGIDGSGTSTQLLQTRRWLASIGILAETTKEPSNGPFGGVIRQALEGRSEFDDTTLALAFAADRADHLFNGMNGVLKSMEQGRWVLCDRYVLSTLAYQATETIELDWLTDLNRFAITPDVTIFVDTPIDACLDRLEKRSSHLELYHERSELERVVSNYRRLIERGEFLGGVAVVDGTGSPEDVSRDLTGQLGGLLGSEEPRLLGRAV